ncbi:MAG: hypothetical protein CV082_12730, partial [Candidatus Brocadia sp. BL1]
ESCASKYKTKHAISTWIYQLLPAIRQIFIISKNNRDALSQFPNRTMLTFIEKLQSKTWYEFVKMIIFLLPLVSRTVSFFG